MDSFNIYQILTLPTNIGEIIDAINIFSYNPDVRGTSLDVNIVPVLTTLKGWLETFNANMRGTEQQIGTLRLRVCYAEQGMQVIMNLLDRVREERVRLRNKIDYYETLQETQEIVVPPDAATIVSSTSKRQRSTSGNISVDDTCIFQRTQRLQKLLSQLVRNVLQCGDNWTGVTLMKNWLAILTDLIPTMYKSPNTPLNQTNMKRINLFCDD